MKKLPNVLESIVSFEKEHSLLNFGTPLCLHLHFIEPLLKCICQEIGMDFLFQIMKFGIVIFFNLAPTGKKNKYNFIINFLQYSGAQIFFYINSKNDSNFVAALHMVQKEENQKAASSEHNSEKATLFKTKIPRNLKLLT